MPATRDRAPDPQTTDYFTLRSGRYQPDYQARSLYEAESRFCQEPPPGYERFAGIKEAQQWAHTLTQTPAFRAAYPQAAGWLDRNPLIVKASRAKQRIGCSVVGGGEIGLSSFDDGAGMVVPVMIHEFSHVVHGNSPAGGFQQAHGSEFAAVYLDMVALVYGDETAARLSNDFKRGGVDVGARRVTDAGGGLIASGRLPRPSRQRTPETVEAARDARHVRHAEKEARKLLKYSPELIEWRVTQNKRFFERAVSLGADLPSQVQRHLTTTPQPRPQPAQRQQRLCNKWMPRARRRCTRPYGHRPGCR